jgi:ubiquinone/menaquinone biosynthesis C-methylase UbiE
MIDAESLKVENLLARPEKHLAWAHDYRTVDNDNFYERAFDSIVSLLDPPAGATFLDAGCGSCAHSVRLAQRGFNVHGVDFSEPALEMGREKIRVRGLEDRITLQRDSLLGLSFPDASFDYALCWGVLMHVPQVELAVAELARVVRPGGSLIISEANQSSFEAFAFRSLKRLVRNRKAEMRSTPAGLEYWVDGGSGALVTREANISWLINKFDEHGLTVRKRFAGQFSEGYTRVSNARLKRLVHGFNDFWFRQVSWPTPAFGNILILQKRK